MTMEDAIVFSTAFRGYSYREVDDYIDRMQEAEKELREGCETLQKKYDTVCEQLTKAVQERDRAVSDCTTLSAALKKLRQDALIRQAENTEDYKAKYEAAAAELNELKARQANLKIPDDGGVRAASDMLSEVAQTIQKLEADARRKAEALTLSAKLEKAQTTLIKTRTISEVRCLEEMLSGFLAKYAAEEPQNEEKTSIELYPEN